MRNFKNRTTSNISYCPKILLKEYIFSKVIQLYAIIYTFINSI